VTAADGDPLARGRPPDRRTRRGPGTDPAQTPRRFATTDPTTVLPDERRTAIDEADQRLEAASRLLTNALVFGDFDLELAATGAIRLIARAQQFLEVVAA
jgi:hypothetical protein